MEEKYSIDFGSIKNVNAAIFELLTETLATNQAVKSLLLAQVAGFDNEEFERLKSFTKEDIANRQREIIIKLIQRHSG